MMIPNPVKTIMQVYSKNLESQLPTTVQAVYLYGSIALDAYIEGSSDIDFVVIINRSLTYMDIKILSQVHFDLEKQFPKLDIPLC
jgi:predicted nucleotidyltransferase